ncbi:MAG: hypothetical protein RQ754_14765 [Desulfuromonadales bacterium]|jgi:hypothetical protein|nr:hypothetical protein [Desulfuromonadales bacterium]
MKAENIISNPIKNTYKAGVYGSLAFVSIALTAFILWSLSCMGGAIMNLLSHS